MFLISILAVWFAFFNLIFFAKSLSLLVFKWLKIAVSVSQKQIIKLSLFASLVMGAVMHAGGGMFGNLLAMHLNSRAFLVFFLLILLYLFMFWFKGRQYFVTVSVDANRVLFALLSIVIALVLLYLLVGFCEIARIREYKFMIFGPVSSIMLLFGGMSGLVSILIQSCYSGCCSKN